MKIKFSKILSLSITLTLVFTFFIHGVMAQQPLAFNSGRNNMYAPSRTVTSEQQTAWNNLSETEKDEVLAELNIIINNSKKQHSQRNVQPKNTALSFVNNEGTFADINALGKSSNRIDLSFTSVEQSPFISRAMLDADRDGLAELFENNLADGFTPLYHVSGGENTGTGFARFNNSAPQTVSQVFGSVPPISHFRVTPLGFGTINGVQYGYIQIDYLTLWNRDDGLNISSLCTNLTAGLGLSLEELISHNLDNERAAILVAAPVTTANQFNTSVSAYKAYQFFTAAHEDTFFDQSLVFSPSQPVDFGWHIRLGFSLSKHGTYPFNPNNLQIFPQYVISSVFSTIDYYFLSGQINEYSYYALYYAATAVFYTCIVERFQDQGGVFAGTRINVGELSNPLNGSNFIQSAELTEKLNKYF